MEEINLIKSVCEIDEMIRKRIFEEKKVENFLFLICGIGYKPSAETMVDWETFQYKMRQFFRKFLHIIEYKMRLEIAENDSYRRALEGHICDFEFLLAQLKWRLYDQD